MEFSSALVRLLLCIEVLVLLTGCSATSRHVALLPTGSLPDDSKASNGQLIVYSATEGHDEDAVYYYPHSAYTILTLDGEKVRYARNKRDKHDETPAVVSLQPGDYRVHARAEGYGYVNVHVTVKLGRTTLVYLCRRNRNSHFDTGGVELVRLPNGRVAGWVADNAAMKLPSQ